MISQPEIYLLLLFVANQQGLTQLQVCWFIDKLKIPISESLINKTLNKWHKVGLLVKREFPLEEGGTEERFTLSKEYDEFLVKLYVRRYSLEDWFQEIESITET